jgi:hypothetical protein
MHSVVGRALMRLAAGLAVVVASLVTPAAIANDWSLSRDLNPNHIHITEATFGGNCSDFAPPPGQVNLTKRGNATTVASQSCDNTDVICPVVVDAVRIGDPAPGCAKDFTVSWRCGTEPTIRRAYLRAEAANNIAWVSCQKQ